MHVAYSIDNGAVVDTKLYIRSKDGAKWIKDLTGLGSAAKEEGHGDVRIRLQEGLELVVTADAAGVHASMDETIPGCGAGRAPFSTSFHGLPVLWSTKATDVFDSLVQARRMFRVEFCFPGMLPFRVSQTREVLAAGMLRFDEGSLASADLRMSIASLGSGGWGSLVKDATGGDVPMTAAPGTLPAAVDALVGDKGKPTHVRCQSIGDLAAVHFRSARYDRLFPAGAAEEFLDALPTTDPQKLLRAVRDGIEKMPADLRAKVVANPVVTEAMQKLEAASDSRCATLCANGLIMAVMSTLMVASH